MSGETAVRRRALGLSLQPASTSCRPPCGMAVMVDTAYEDGHRGPQISAGCQCSTGPTLLLSFMSVWNIERIEPSQSFGPSSCSVSDD